MSHVDEGALHAYLDGALDEYPVAEARRIREHLDACAECAEGLEVERALRSDAHEMLGMAAPSVDLPSFEELRAYVERTRRAPSRTSVRITRLSWAASVMLAVGIGWTVRGGRLEPVADMSGSAPVAVAEQEGAILAREGFRENSAARLADAPAEIARSTGGAQIGPEAFASRADLPESAVAKSSDDMDASDVLSSVVEESADMPAESPALGAMVSADVDERAVAAPSTTEVVTAEVVAAELVAASEVQGLRDAAALQAQEPLRQASLDEITIGGTASDVLDAATDDTAFRLSAVDVVAAGDTVEEDEEARPERRRAESATAFTSQFSAGRGSVRVVPEDDDRFEDEPLQSVPGFEVLASDNIGDGTVFLGTVATQRLEGEDVMQVFLLEPEVELDVLPPLDPSVNEVRVQAETGWVVLRGPRSEDELETLLMRLFPG